MSYQVLARKWRPNSFEQVVGQQHVLQALINALETQRLHHAYLFSGTRGVGKTSIARLLAKALNCEVGVSATPCGQCQSCQEIEQGNFIDLIEIDAASKTKVEDTREILDNVQYKPTRARYKVYLIDEVHMLSRSSFNALLKTLEEPPEHVKFLFATTETQKLPVTILSRCLQFNLKALAPPQIIGQLDKILQAEKVEFDQPSLAMLANAADGSMRDALSLTDQAISHGSGVLQETVVAQMLGTLDSQYSLRLLNLASNNKATELFELVEKIAEFGPDYDQLLKQMILDVHHASMAKIVKGAARLATQSKELWQFSKQTDAELLQLYYSILLQGRKELEWASDQKSGFEMALLRILAFLPGVKASMPDDSAPNVAAPQDETDDESSDKTLTGLMAQQQNLQQQASELTPQKKTLNIESKQHTAMIAAPVTQNNSNMNINDVSPTVNSVAAPIEAEPLTEALIVEQTQVAPLSDSNNPPQSAFSDDELMNMSMAESADEQSYDAYDNSADDLTPSAPVNNLNPMATSSVLQPTFTVKPALNSRSDNAPSSGINDFLKARKSLRDKSKENAEKDGSTKESTSKDSIDKKGTKVKKPPAAVAKHHSPHSATPTPLRQSPVMSNELTLDTPAEATLAISDDKRDVPVINPFKFAVKKSSAPQNAVTVDSDKSVALVDDPATLLAPNTLDEWSILIDEMALGGRLRQLAIHSSYQIDDKNVLLTLAQAHRHLNADSAVATLQKNLSLVLNIPIEITVELGSTDQKTPFEISSELHVLRLQLAQQCIETDKNVLLFQQQFAATIEQPSIKYRTIKAIN
ncbi:MAG: DNA polymerase III subunit gamma/tau [Psychrobium sp.]|nr:DNA polymerase III subunit gamma/tau [Psychrobium sp.]